MSANYEQIQQAGILPIDEILKNATPWQAASARSCIYALMNGDQVIYVGQTCNLMARLTQHEKTKEFNSYWSTDVSRECASIMEARYIVALNPRLNSTLPLQSEFMMKNAAKSMLGGIALRKAIKAGIVTGIGLHLGTVFRSEEIETAIWSDLS